MLEPVPLEPVAPPEVLPPIELDPPAPLSEPVPMFESLPIPDPLPPIVPRPDIEPPGRGVPIAEPLVPLPVEPDPIEPVEPVPLPIDPALPPPAVSPLLPIPPVCAKTGNAAESRPETANASNFLFILSPPSMCHGRQRHIKQVTHHAVAGRIGLAVGERVTRQVQILGSRFSRSRLDVPEPVRLVRREAKRRTASNNGGR
jgi:hypothetical protein